MVHLDKDILEGYSIYNGVTTGVGLCGTEGKVAAKLDYVDCAECYKWWEYFIKNTLFDFVDRHNSVFSANSCQQIVKDPGSINALDEFIRYRMRKSTILRIVVGNLSDDLAPEWAGKVFAWLHELSVKYKPWQFKAVCQISGTFEVDWTETNSSLFKYGGIVD